MKAPILFLVISFPCLPPTPWADSTMRCLIEPKSVDGTLKKSTAVFSGEVVEVKSGVNFLQARFSVERFWKGVETDEVSVLTDGSAESPHYRVGEKYLVFAGIRNDKLFTGMCSRTKKLEYAGGDLRQLGEGNRQSPINPATVYDQAGVTVVSPNQSGWRLLKSDKSQTLFEKDDKDVILRAEVKTFITKVFAADKDLLASLENLKQEELNKLKRDSVHFNFVRFKLTSCLQYDGVFKDGMFIVDGKSSPKFSYLNLKGFLCPLPGAKDSVVQMEFSNYSNLRGFTAEVSDLSDEFFEKVVFPKIADR